MKVGDLMVFCDGFTPPEIVTVTAVFDDCAHVLNELGVHRVDLCNLVVLDDEMAKIMQERNA